MNRIFKKLHRVAFAAAGKIGACKIKDTIVIAGSPRSGTTLLLEALHKLPGYKAINEPLIKKQVRREYGFTLRNYIALGKSTHRHQKFFIDVIQGQIDQRSTRWLFEADTEWGRLIEHGYRNKLVVKFCRINQMLPWFAEQFDVRAMIFIIRHPCAVVNSMLRFGQWDRWTWDYVQQDRIAAPTVQIDHLPEGVQAIFKPVIEQISSQTEALALMWCLDHYMPLVHANQHPWILVPFERLITQKLAELKRINSALGSEMKDEVLETLYKPSSSVKEPVKDNPESQILKWKHQLTKRQIDEILSIVHEVNLSNIYTEDEEPHYEYLNLLQKPM